MIIEDKSFIPVIKNYFLYMKFSVRVISMREQYRIERKTSDLILLGSGKRPHLLISTVKALQRKIPGIKILCLSASKTQKLPNTIGGVGTAFIRERADLFRIYKRIEQLRKEA